MQERNERKLRAKAIAASRRRQPHRFGRAFDLVTLSLAIWLSVLTAAEGLQKLGEMTPDSGLASNPSALQTASLVSVRH